MPLESEDLPEFLLHSRTTSDPMNERTFTDRDYIDIIL